MDVMFRELIYDLVKLVNSKQCHPFGKLSNNKGTMSCIGELVKEQGETCNSLHT